MKVTGDADAYTLMTVLGVELDGPTPSVDLYGGFSLSPASISNALVLTPPHNDDDLVFDVVTVEI